MRGKRGDRIIVDDPHAAPSTAEVLADLAKVRATFQLRALATVMGAPLPMPGALSMRIEQGAGQLAASFAVPERPGYSEPGRRFGAPAMVGGTPDPATFASETHKDRNSTEERPA